VYLTAQELMERFDAAELAQVAPPQSMARVSAELMRATILGEDTSAFPADEVEAAAAGLQRIDDALADASQEIDGRLARRYTLPLDPVPSLMKRVAANTARFFLHDDSATEEIRKRYEDSIRTLKALAAGDMRLGQDDPNPGGTAGPVGTKDKSDRVFTNDTLSDF